MQFIIYMIIPCVISLIMPLALGIMKKTQKEKEKRIRKDKFVMKASKEFSICFLVFTVIWAIAIIILNICDDISIWVNIILWVSELFLVIGCIQSFRQKIVVGAKDLLYTPIFGKSKSVKITDIEKVVVCSYSGGMRKYKIFVSGKVFCSFADTAVGASLLIDILRENHVRLIEKAQ